MPRIALLASLIALWLLCLLWQAQENRSLARTLSNARLPDALRKKLLSQARMRSFQFLLTLAGCASITMLYDWKLSRLPATVVVEAPPPRQATPALEGTLIRPPSPAAKPTGADAELYALLEPQSGGAAGKLDDLKQRYEDLFTEYFYLSRCGSAKPDDYDLLNTALSEELASLQGPGRLSYDILTAARGTYHEVYAKTPCDTPEAAATRDRFRAYMDALRAREKPLEGR